MHSAAVADRARYRPFRSSSALESALCGAFVAANSPLTCAAPFIPHRRIGKCIHIAREKRAPRWMAAALGFAIPVLRQSAQSMIMLASVIR
ncbi:hypothetical protein [Kutzneria sp. CA-103260]|uniref:hypothetical protein n=1 Tax=Kutzneria sp. CA-103260 TaxID=2802641 RepID=UPI001BABE5A4|nr:hypothetical protein [Kutzneria sp. CA-103260]